MHFLQKARASRAILALDVAPKRNYVAVCEQSVTEGTAQVSVFHAGTRNRMRTMTLACQGQFTSCAFSADGKRLITQADSTDYPLTVWKWEQEKAVASTAVGTAVTRVRGATGEAAQLAFSPAAPCICVTGPRKRMAR